MFGCIESLHIGIGELEFMENGTVTRKTQIVTSEILGFFSFT